MQGKISQRCARDCPDVEIAYLSLSRRIRQQLSTVYRIPIFKVYKQKELLEDNYNLSSTKSPERRVFYVDVGTCLPTWLCTCRTCENRYTQDDILVQQVDKMLLIVYTIPTHPMKTISFPNSKKEEDLYKELLPVVQT